MWFRLHRDCVGVCGVSGFGFSALIVVVTPVEAISCRALVSDRRRAAPGRRPMAGMRPPEADGGVRGMVMAGRSLARA